MSDIKTVSMDKDVESTIRNFKALCTVDIWAEEESSPVDFSKIQVGDLVKFRIYCPDGTLEKLVYTIDYYRQELMTTDCRLVPKVSIIGHECLKRAKLTEPENAGRVASVLSEFEFFNMDERYYCRKCGKFVPTLQKALIIKGITFCSELCRKESEKSVCS